MTALRLVVTLAKFAALWMKGSSMSAKNDFLLPEGTLIIGALVPAVGVDTVSALQLMNKDIYVGRLIEPYHEKSTTLHMTSALHFGEAHFTHLHKTTLPRWQRIPSGEIVVSIVRNDPREHIIFAQCPQSLIDRLEQHVLDDRGNCKLGYHLAAAAVILEVLRDMVGKTPIRI